MTKHTPNPNCDCDHCYVDDLNAVLRAFVEQREARQHNAAAVKREADKSAWRDVAPDELRCLQARVG